MAIRVGNIGMLGNLGSRLLAALSRDPDFELAVGVVQPDNNLVRALSALATNQNLKDISWAKKMFMAAKHSEVKKWNDSQTLIIFLPVDQLALKAECDVVIDVTNYGSQQLMEQYNSFGGPVILQSGAKEGSLISPPLVTPSVNGVYRQGDCLVSALIPALSVFKDLQSVRMHLIKQFGEKLGDYPTSDRLNAIYLDPDVDKNLNKELAVLLPEVEVKVDGVYQIPGLKNYLATLALVLENEISGDELRAKLSSAPRMIVAGGNIISTYDVDYYLRSRLQMSGIGIPPIVVYGSTLKPNLSLSSKEVFLQIAIYYKMIAVLPNLDALRILCLGEKPLEAMRNTDKLAAKLSI